MAKDTETVLEGFQEGPLKFPPTYKFDVGTNTYDTRYRLKSKPSKDFPFTKLVHAHIPPGYCRL